jgi:hypothetical protein
MDSQRRIISPSACWAGYPGGWLNSAEMDVADRRRAVEKGNQSSILDAPWISTRSALLVLECYELVIASGCG